MLQRLLSRPLYIQLSPRRVMLRDPKSGRVIDEVAEIATGPRPDGKTLVLGVGADARGAAAQGGGQVHAPFAHPRSLVSDFVLAQQLLKALVRRVSGGGWLQLSPSIVLHPLGEHEGGLTQVEIRALQELALGSGAVAVQLWQGPALSDAQLLSGERPSGGRVLSAR